MTPETVFLTLGGLFLAALVADAVGTRTRIPRVTLLLLIGLVVGQSGLDLIPDSFEALLGYVSTLALAMVAFLLGNSLTLEKVRAHGRAILALSLSIVFVTLVIVTFGLWAMGMALSLALILAAIATATAPAATLDTLREAGAVGGFADTIRGVVAIDDAWGLIVFSLVLVVAGHVEGNGDQGHILLAVREIGGACLVGVGLGLPAALLSGRLTPGEPLQTEALAIVFLLAGLCAWLQVPVLLAGLVAGVTVANVARHHERPFHEIEHIQWPFLLVFFLMAGAKLDLGQLGLLGGVGAAYVILRIAARLVGGWIGAKLGGMTGAERAWIGPALLPQAGVAVGMALVAASTFPDHAGTIMTLVVGTTIIFELLGPPVTRLALARAGALGPTEDTPEAR